MQLRNEINKKNVSIFTKKYKNNYINMVTQKFNNSELTYNC